MRTKKRGGFGRPFCFTFAAMQCLETLVGLRGGCAEVTSDAGVFTDPYMTRGELAKFVDQNDYPNGVDELFQRLRETAEASKYRLPR